MYFFSAGEVKKETNKHYTNKPFYLCSMKTIMQLSDFTVTHKRQFKLSLHVIPTILYYLTV